uniref:Putative alpha-13-mannosyl-glycoprotein 4-beta-n-acetylglucosaminyltransferase b n=1 Tax=Ornithodoros turicata TaxID=34597 RepID=A0A2R5LNF2_9ACAR
MILRKPATFYFVLIAVTTPFFTIFLMMHKPDLSEEVALVQKLAELQERLRHAEMMNQQRWQDMVALQRVVLNNETSILDLQLPSIFHFLPHLASDPEAFRPALKVSAGRTAASMVLGIPTVKREVQSYLMATLHNLIENMTPQERNTCLIVVFIAEVDKEFVTKQATEIQEEFTEYVESGLLEVISPPASFYPDMDKLKQTLGDPLERVKWRTKQTLDFAYLMMYAQGKGTFYVQLEDDILSKPGYIRKMSEYAYKQVSLKKDWLILDFCQLGFIGKMFKCVDLSKFIVFFLIFHNDKPVDWLLDHMVQTKVCRFDKDIKDCKKRKDQVWIHYKPSLFQHVGTHSSLKGKVQKLKDHQFGKLSLFVVHHNPPAEVSTTLKVYKAYNIARAYKGDNFFWSLLPQKGDNVTFRFTPPIRIERFLFRSGNPEHPEDRFYNTTVEVQLDYEPVPLPLPRTADGFYVVGSFKDTTGLAASEVPPETGLIRTMRLNVQADATRWAILSEIHIKEYPSNSTHR